MSKAKVQISKPNSQIQNPKCRFLILNSSLFILNSSLLLLTAYCLLLALRLQPLPCSVFRSTFSVFRLPFHVFRVPSPVLTPGGGEPQHSGTVLDCSTGSSTAVPLNRSTAAPFSTLHSQLFIVATRSLLLTPYCSPFASNLRHLLPPTAAQQHCMTAALSLTAALPHCSTAAPSFDCSTFFFDCSTMLLLDFLTKIPYVLRV
jgi:hypothetical protein